MFFDSGFAAVDLFLFQDYVLALAQRIAVDDIGQRDFVSFLADALEGDGRLAAPVKHAKADTRISDHGQGLDRDVYETDAQVAGPDGSGRSGWRRILTRRALFRLSWLFLS